MFLTPATLVSRSGDVNDFHQEILFAFRGQSVGWQQNGLPPKATQPEVAGATIRQCPLAHFTCTGSCANVAAYIMDKFWSICCMPIGVLFCFGPILVAWWLAERKSAVSKITKEND